MRKWIAAFLCVSMVLFTGCSNMTQLHERLIVQGVGIDIVDGQYVVTMQVFDAINSGGNEGEESLVVSAQGKSVLDAFTNITLQTGKEPLYSQNMAVVIGEETARQGIYQVLDFFIRYYEARPEVDIFVVKDTALKLLRSKGEDGKLIKAQDLSSLADSGELNANAMQSTVRQVVAMLQNDTSDPHMLALKMTERGEGFLVSADGTALFQQDQLVGYLGLDETQGAMMLQGSTSNGTQVVSLPDIGTVTYSFQGVDSEVEIKIQDQKPDVTFRISAQANLFEIDHAIEDKLPSDTFDVIQAALEQRIKQLCEQALQTAVVKYHSDIFHLGNLLWQQQPDYYRQVAEQWDEEMAHCNFHVEVKAEIRRVGQEVNPM